MQYIQNHNKFILTFLEHWVKPMQRLKSTSTGTSIRLEDNRSKRKLYKNSGI